MLTDGSSLASDLNAIIASAEENLLGRFGSERAVERAVNEALQEVMQVLSGKDEYVAALVINTLTANMVRTLMHREVPHPWAR